MTDASAIFLADTGIDAGQFVKVILQGFLLSWPVWVAVGLLMLGYLALGIYRRIVRARSRSRWR